MIIYFIIVFNFLFFTLYSYNFDFKVFFLSFFFGLLNKHKNIGSVIGIKYINDYDIVVNRKEYYNYVPFFQQLIFQWFCGVNINSLKDPTNFFKFTKFISKIKNINFDKYIDKIINKELKISEFSLYLSEILVKEIEEKSDINIINKLSFENIKIISELANNILKPLSLNIIMFFLINLKKLINLSFFLKSLDSIHRISILVSQISIPDKLIKYILYNDGNLSNINFCDLMRNLNYDSNDEINYYVLLNKQNIIFVKKNYDNTNSPINRVFGVKGFQCPGATFVFNIINDNLSYFKNVKVNLLTKPIYITSGNRQYVKNVDQLKIIIKKIK